MSDGHSDDQHPKKDKAKVHSPSKEKGRKNDVGRALRTAYDETLRESIPKDFLDLLGKLD